MNIKGSPCREEKFGIMEGRGQQTATTEQQSPTTVTRNSCLPMMGLDSTLLIGHVFPYLNRKEYGKLSSTTKELHEIVEASPVISPPWPQELQLHVTGFSSRSSSSSRVFSVALSSPPPITTMASKYDMNAEDDVPKHSKKRRNEHWLACGCHDGTIRLWNSRATDERGSICKILKGPHGYHGIFHLYFHPTKPYLLISGSNDATICIWDLRYSPPTQTLIGENIVNDHNHDSFCRIDTCEIALSTPAGNYIACAYRYEGDYPDPNTNHIANVSIWSVSSGKCIQRWGVSNDKNYYFNSLAFGGTDGDDDDGLLYLSMAAKDTTIIWNLSLTAFGKKTSTTKDMASPAVHAVLKQQGGPIKMMTFLPIMKQQQQRKNAGLHQNESTHRRSSTVLRLATVCSESDIQLWDIVSDQPRISRTIGKRHEHGYMIMSIAFSPDGTSLAAGLYDSTIRIFRVEDGKCVDTLSGKHKDAVRSVTFGDNNRRLLTGSWDGTIHLWTLPDYYDALVPPEEAGGCHHARKRQFVEK